MATVRLSRNQSVNLSALTRGNYVTPTDAVKRRAAQRVSEGLKSNDLCALAAYFRSRTR